MPVTREFLGWERPCLIAATEYLLARYTRPGTLDLRSVCIVLPGSRAGRRLLERLVEAAHDRRISFDPPRITTISGALELLAHSALPQAGGLARWCAWLGALRDTPAGELTSLLGATADAGKPLALLSLAKVLDGLHQELAAQALDFDDVRRTGLSLKYFPDADRWQGLARIQNRYLELLRQVGFIDPQRAKLQDIHEAAAENLPDFVFVAVADASGALCKLLDRPGVRATALVFAPESLADRFDGYGRLQAQAWNEAPLDLADEQLITVDQPADQAGAVLATIAGYQGVFSAEQITVGLADPQLLEPVKSALQKCGVRCRYAEGIPIEQQAVVRLLTAAAGWLAEGSVTAFASLVRHPDLASCLSRRRLLDLDGEWLEELDDFVTEVLPASIHRGWADDCGERRELKQLVRAVHELLSDLSGAPRLLSAWAEPICELLEAVYGGVPIDPQRPSARDLINACDLVAATLQEVSNLPAKLAPHVAAWEAMNLVCEGLAGQFLPPDTIDDAVELLGWLELALDDAPALIVTGVNEGNVPTSVNAHAFLPNSLREHLGIQGNLRRYARDAYALASMRASKERLTLIAGRKDADGDPLLPSRLIFACDAQVAARRVLDSCRPADRSHRRQLVRRPRTGSIEIPRPVSLDKPIDALTVTAFGDYIACPYRFYLRHVARLGAVDDTAVELHGGAFGTVLHNVLAEFGTSQCARSESADEIREFLVGTLAKAARRSFGGRPKAAVQVQLANMELRLAAIAAAQAAWRRDGWEIEYVELPFRHSGESGRWAILDVDGEPFHLLGRIDRVDLNRTTGERAVIDYKSNDRGDNPDKSHRKSGQWTSLQLPLYRHLMRSLGVSEKIRLGYFNLPKKQAGCGWSEAQWSDDDLAEADEVARHVVRQIRRQVFWPPEEGPVNGFDEYAWLCQESGLPALAELGEDGE